MTRQLGIRGAVRPAKKSTAITPSNFEIAAMVGRFDRQYAVAFEITRPDEIRTIFGEANPNFYGEDSANGFFQNADGGSLWIKSHVGNDGAVIDAVQAFLLKNDVGANPAIRFGAAYREIVQYGSSGNRIAFKVTNGYRYETTLAAAALAGDDTISLDAIGDARVGDIVEIVLTAGPATIFRKIIAINESAGTAQLNATLGTAGTIGDTFKVRGMRIQTAVRSRAGVLTEVERDLGAVYVTTEPEVADYYYQNVHRDNRWLALVDQNSVSTLNDRFLADSSDWEFLATGADGTSPSTVAHWTFNNASLDNIPYRIFFNPETTLEAYWEAMDVYGKTRVRTDFPVNLAATAKNLAFENLRNAGRRYQRNELRLIIPRGSWYQITDLFANSVLAPPRDIPPVGHDAGVWIRTVRDFGVHFSPSTTAAIVRGIVGVVNREDWSDDQRTKLFDAGVTITQFVAGVGYQIRNWITSSTAREWFYGHTVLQANFYRESVKESLRGKDNEPNVAKRVQNGKDAINAFMAGQWRAGSNGRVPEGETFGQYLKEDNTFSTPADSYEVIGDVRNNPKAKLDAGERDYDLYFRSPTPTGSIEIGVGIDLR